MRSGSQCAERSTGRTRLPAPDKELSGRVGQKTVSAAAVRVSQGDKYTPDGQARSLVAYLAAHRLGGRGQRYQQKNAR